MGSSKETSTTPSKKNRVGDFTPEKSGHQKEKDPRGNQWEEDLSASNGENSIIFLRLHWARGGCKGAGSKEDPEKKIDEKGEFEKTEIPSNQKRQW